MKKLKVKLALYNLSSKLIFTLLFVIFMPPVFQRINLHQVDHSLIDRREDVIKMISEVGIEPFIASDSTASFGSFDILKEEFISLERIDTEEDLNYIDISERLIDNEKITYRIINYTFDVDGKKYLLEAGKSISSIKRTQRNMMLVLMIVWGFVVVVTFIADLQYHRFVLRPLDKITSKLTKISNPSMFDRKAVKTKTEDFATLDTALIGLMDHIQLLFNKEREITVNISHELLTPISIIRSKLENLLMYDAIDNETAARTEDSLKTLYRLQGLVKSLLLIARIESHQYLRNEQVSIISVLNEIRNELLPMAEDKGVLITTDDKDQFNLKEGNRSLIFSMFYNVINNSLKNTTSGGSVVIRTSKINGSFRVEVEDNGCGMNDEQLKILFSRFKTQISDSYNGHGIGLAISKTIADFHRISITVKSEPGRGSIFSFGF